jgi:predicted RNA-binding protein with PUA-like domain
MQYWLMKSEPEEFSIDDLERKRREPWDGVRNYQARNMMRDQMKLEDLIFFYHSNCKEIGIVGIMKVVEEGHPDPCAFKPDDPHYDPKSDPDNPRWYLVDVGFIEKFNKTISLQTLKAQAALSEMPLVRKGNRLSVMPVSEAEWHYILGMKEGKQ